MGMFDDKKFHLDKEYELRVTVKRPTGSFAAELTLSPGEISLRVRGDQIGFRSWGALDWELDTLECDGVTTKVILFDLHCIKSGYHNISDGIATISHLEIDYVASYAIVTPNSYHHINYKSIHIHSPSLSKWVGYTEKQQEIVEDQIGGTRAGLISGFDKIDLNEICVSCEDSGEACVYYDLQAKANPFEFEVGIRFPPVFSFFATEDISLKDIMPLYLKIYSFLSLLHGHELIIDCIELCEGDHTGTESYLYIANSIRPEREDYSWFPLGHKLRFDGSPVSFPREAIAKYFSNQYMRTNTWWKYIKYRRMDNVEERFLGYFRLLESLTKKSKTYLDSEALKHHASRAERLMTKLFGSQKDVRSFLGGIERYNKTKYNTEKCMGDFYKRLPQELTKNWSIKPNDLKAVIKLRNDISHANDYYISPDDLLAKSIFLESMLLVALLETIGVTVADSSKMIGRLSGAHLIIAGR